MVAHTANGDEWSPPFGIFWHQAFQRWRPPFTRLDLTWIYLNPERIDELRTESYRAAMMCGLFGDVWQCLVIPFEDGLSKASRNQSWCGVETWDLLHLILCPLDRTSYDNVWHAAHCISLSRFETYNMNITSAENYDLLWCSQEDEIGKRPIILTHTFWRSRLLGACSRLERIENGGLEKQRVDLVLSCAWA